MKVLILTATLIVEGVLLVLILATLVIGLLGIFIPLLPGLLLVGVAAGLYSLMVKSDYGKITPHLNRFFLKIKNRIFNLKLTHKIMELFLKIKNRKKEKIKKQIWRYGLMLLGFNAILILAFILSFISLIILSGLINLSEILIALIPILVVFIFAGGSGIVWYRFGQFLKEVFKKKRIYYSTLTVVISLIPLLAFLILISAMTNLANPLALLVFFGISLMVALAAAFELLVVNLGVLT